MRRWTVLMNSRNKDLVYYREELKAVQEPKVITTAYVKKNYATHIYDFLRLIHKSINQLFGGK